jgi:hypothetical protein
MKTDLSVYAPDGGVTVFHEPPIKWRMIGQRATGVAEQDAVKCGPPPTLHTSPLETMKTLFRLFVAPIATPLVHMNPFQWKMVGSNGFAVETFPTIHPSFGLIGPVNGGPKLTDVKLFNDGLVSVPQFEPSKCAITPAVPTAHPSAAVVKKTELRLKWLKGDSGIRLIGSAVHVPPS